VVSSPYSTIRKKCLTPRNFTDLFHAVDETLREINHFIAQQYDNEHKELLNWISPHDYRLNQMNLSRTRLIGTGDWLLHSEDYRFWINYERQTLFCPGIPGAGKTIIASAVVDDLLMKFGNEDSIGIAFLYFNYRNPDQTPSSVLESLLKQLLQTRSTIPDLVLASFHYNRRKSSRPSFENLVAMMHAVIQDTSRTFIILDALDECAEMNGRRTNLLLDFFRLQNLTGLNLFVTSRPLPEIMKLFEDVPCLEIRAADHDIRKYIQDCVSHFRIFPRLDTELRDLIIERVSHAANGMCVI
jgi:Cdc6-like AAA superfamily ATPase